MRPFAILFIVFSIFICCNTQTPCPEKPKNEVLVMGMIHGSHRTDSVYTVAYVEKLIREIKPDYILAEIPPDRMQAAMDGFKRDDSISEPRVLRFPEYVDVIFPLTKEMDFEIIPTAGWTRPMALERSQKLRAISQDTSRTQDWEAYTAANSLSCLLYTSPSPRDQRGSRMPSSA